MLTNTFRVAGSEAPFMTALAVPVDTDGDFIMTNFFGSAEAIGSLAFTFNHEGLTLPLTFEKDGDAVFDEAFKNQTDVFSITSDINTVRTEQTSSHGVGDAINEEKSGTNTTRCDTVTIPVLVDGFDIEKAAIRLLEASRTDELGRTYDLGLITQCPGRNALDVVILPSFPHELGTNTVWMFHKIEKLPTGGQIQLWSTLVPIPTVQVFLVAPAAMTIASTSFNQYSAATSSSVGPFQSSLPINTAANPGPLAAPIASIVPTAHTFQPLPAAAKASDLVVQPDWSAAGDLSDEEILNGRNGIGAGDIKGDILLRLALSHSNSTLATRIGQLYEKDNVKARTENNLTKRLTKAFHDRATLLAPLDSQGAEIPLATLRTQFDDYRRMKDLRNRVGHAPGYCNKRGKRARSGQGAGESRTGKRNETTSEESAQNEEVEEEGEDNHEM